MDQTQKVDKRLIQRLDPYIAQIAHQFSSEIRLKLNDPVIELFLIGSYATNSYTVSSDIDFLIIVDKYTTEHQWEASSLASDYSLKYNLCFSTLVQGISTWKKNKQARTLFYKNVMQEGIRL